MNDADQASDDRLRVGVGRQQELLREMTAAGTAVLGWKAGLGAPQARVALGLSAPLIGFLPDTTRHRDGTTLSVATWRRPLAEAEVAVRIARDVPARTGDAEALGAVDAVAPAIELVDLPSPPEDPVEVLGGNIFHRAWLTGAFTPLVGPLDLSAATAIVRVEGPRQEDLGTIDALEALTGTAGAVLAETARMAGRIGRGLRAGDVVLLGSVVPPRQVGPGDTFRMSLDEVAVGVSLR